MAKDSTTRTPATPSSHHPRTGRSPSARVLLLALVLAAIVPYLGALRADFVFDDRGLVVENPGVWESTPTTILSTSYWPDQEGTGLYRPLTGLSYWIDGKLWGQRPVGFHLTNIWLHLLVVLALWSLLSRLFPNRRWPVWITCLLFAVHPLHSEAVFAVVGRAELLAALCGILGYGWAARWAETKRLSHLVGSIVMFMLAALSKESATGLLLLPILHGWTRWTPGPPAIGAASGQPTRWRILAMAWTLGLALVFLLRTRILGSIFGLAPVGLVDNPLAHCSAVERVLTGLGIQGWLLLKLIFPIHLSADYSYPQIAPTPLWLASGGLVAVCSLVALGYLLRRQDWPLRWAAAFLLATGLLTANLAFPIGTVFGERLTYLPSAAALWALVMIGSRGLRGPSSARLALAVLLAVYTIALGARTGLRGREWHDNVALFRAATQTSSRSVKSWTNLSFSLLETKQFESAIEAARTAERLDPHYPATHLALGSSLSQAGRPLEALPYLKRASGMAGRRRVDAALELGNAYLLLGSGGQAESTFVAAKRLGRPDEFAWTVGMASALALQSRWPQSRTAWQNAVSLRPDDPEVQQRYAYALWQDGSPDEAEVAYRRALGLRPADPALRNDLAWFLVKTARAPAEGLRLAESAFQDSPTANIADTVLEAWLATGGCPEAQRWLRGLETNGLDDLIAPLTSKLAERCASRDDSQPGDSR